MAKAIWNGHVIAESDKHETVEGNIYFPPGAVKREYFTPSNHITRCAWKGTAHYYDEGVGGKENTNAAWYYPEPSPAAKNIKDHVAFWHGVQMEK